FGWVAVNPPWLAKRFYAPKPLDAAEAERQKRRDPRPSPWPGLETVERQTLLETLAAAKRARVRLQGEEGNQKIGELAAYAARVHGPTEVAAYLRGLAGRANDRGWKRVEDVLRTDLTELK